MVAFLRQLLINVDFDPPAYGQPAASTRQRQQEKAAARLPAGQGHKSPRHMVAEKKSTCALTIGKIEMFFSGFVAS